METKPTEIVRATISPSGRQYDVLPGQSLLEAGLSAGIALPFGCANGSCGDCQARLLNGQVKKIRNHDFLLTEAQKLDGGCLLCSTTAVTDVQIDVLVATSVDDIPEQQLQAKLCRIEHKPDVSIVAFKFTRGKALRFLPGQRVKLTLASGDTVELPIASCPCDAQYVEFHLFANTAHKDDSGQFGESVFSKINERKRVSIMLNDESDVPCCLLWKASENVPQYRSNLCRSWHDAFDQFDFVQIAKDATVLTALPEHWHAQLSSCEAYFGKKDSTLFRQLTELGVDPASIAFPNHI